MGRPFNAAALLGTVAALALGGPLASAQDAGTSESAPSVYDAAFFARFAPQTALDMAEQVPGFSIEEVQAGRRGFTGATGNVLIDGAQPTAKSLSTREILSRIPASQVLRLEVIRAGASAQAAGQATVLNVVRQPASGTVLVEVQADVTKLGRATPNLDASWTGRLGPVELTLGGAYQEFFTPLEGVRVLRNGQGQLTGTRYDFTPRTFSDTSMTVEARAPVLGGRLGLNLKAGRELFDTVLDSAGRDAQGLPTDRFTLTLDYRTETAEVGLDFERPLGALTLNVLGLATRTRVADDDETVDFALTATPLGGARQDLRQSAGETVGRVQLQGKLGASLDWTVGLEGARNTLDQRLRLTEDGVPVRLPAANVTVSEDRGEGFVTVVWRARPAWTVEGGLAHERSRLTQSGDSAGAEAAFQFWKPTLQISRALGGDSQLRLRLVREVDQLDFTDFASAGDLNDQRVGAGNPELEPETEWDAQLTLDQRFAGDGSLVLTASYRAIDNVIDIAPIGAFDGPANIGSAEIAGLAAEATVPLGRLLPGGQLQAEGRVREFRVTDPTTLRSRDISNRSETSYSLNLRQDLPARRLAWGLGLNKEGQSQQYLRRELSTYEEGPFLNAFIDRSLPGGAKLRLYGENLLDTTFQRERAFFAPDRTGSLARTDARERTSGSRYGLELTASF